MEKGIDVTKGGAKYNLSGIQFIQVANLADSLAVIKQLVFDEQKVSAKVLEEALKNNFANQEILSSKIIKSCT